MTTNAISGQGISLYIGGDLVAGSKAFAISFSEATIDVTSRDDAFQGAFLPGRRDWKLDIDALYVYTDVAKKIMLTGVNSGTLQPVTVLLTMPDGATFAGSATITSLALAMPDESVVTYKASLQGTGALTISVS